MLYDVISAGLTFGESMIKKFIHPELGKEVRALAGYYTPIEENVILYNGRKVIYIGGSICIDSSCCGVGNWSYIQIPGYLIRERIDDNGTPLPVSEIETIQDEADRKNIRQLLLEKYPSARIEIW
jgi:hypothetical protein